MESCNSKIERQCLSDFESFRTYGVHRINLSSENKTITINSAPNWEQFLEQTNQIKSSDFLVVSPELITLDKDDFENICLTKGKVESRISEFQEVSKNNSDTMFVVGTPVFDDENPKPKNCALVIKNGEIIASTSKKSASSEVELLSFQQIAEDPALIIPETRIGVLICSDLVTAVLSKLPKRERFFRLKQYEHLKGKNPEFIPPEASSLILLTRWASDGFFGEPKDSLSELKVMAENAINLFPNLQEIVVSDCSPPEKMDVPPLNTYIKKLNR